METGLNSALRRLQLQASVAWLGMSGTSAPNWLKSGYKTAPLVFLNYTHANTVLVCFNILYILSMVRAEKRSRNSEQFNVHVSTNSSHETQFCFRQLQMVLLAVKLHL